MRALLMPHYELSHYYMLQNQEISKKEKYNIDKLQKRLRRNVGEAIADFNMIGVYGTDSGAECQHLSGTFGSEQPGGGG